jgi:hypothetical protein
MSATVVIDEQTGEVKIFVDDKLRGHYKSHAECFEHFVMALIQIDELESANSKLLAACKASLNFVDDPKIQNQVIAAIENQPIQGCRISLESDASNFYGAVISLRSAIRELRCELTIDICEDRPRLVMMAMADLEMRADHIVESMTPSSRFSELL